MVYADENNGSFSGGVAVNWNRGEWLDALNKYYQKKPYLLFCPVTTLRRGPGAQEVAVPVSSVNVVEYGGPTTAYDFPLTDPQAPSTAPVKLIISSYGANNWIYDPPPGTT